MNAQLLEESLKRISNPHLLVNVISKRSKQLNSGHRPLVEVVERQDAIDIAARELLEDQLEISLPSFDVEEV